MCTTLELHLPSKVRFVDAEGDPFGEAHRLRLAEFIREHSPRPRQALLV
jgi:hypothetical protein